MIFDNGHHHDMGSFPMEFDGNYILLAIIGIVVFTAILILILRTIITELKPNDNTTVIKVQNNKNIDDKPRRELEGQTKRKYCHECGAKIQDQKQIFCNYCGARL